MSIEYVSLCVARWFTKRIPNSKSLTRELNVLDNDTAPVVNMCTIL